MTPGQSLFILVLVVACAWAGEAIGKSKGHAGAGFLLGLLLGAIGVVIIACFPKSQEQLVKEAQARLAAEEEARRRMGGYPPQPPPPPQWPNADPWQRQ